MFDKIMRVFRGVSSGQGDVVDRSTEAVFTLCMGELPMLVLARDDSGWTLRYTDQFKEQDRVSPLVPFPDVNKIYESTEIWPFFAVRIPSIARPEIERTVRAEKLDYSDVAAMLSRFGKRSIADPFELRRQSVGVRQAAAL